jgi:hypothetical protein
VNVYHCSLVWPFGVGLFDPERVPQVVIDITAKSEAEARERFASEIASKIRDGTIVSHCVEFFSK